jgi:hypothetical protein
VGFAEVMATSRQLWGVIRGLGGALNLSNMPTGRFMGPRNTPHPAANLYRDKEESTKENNSRPFLTLGFFV